MGRETIGRSSNSLLSFLDLTSQGIGPDRLEPAVSLGMEGLSFLGDSSFRLAQDSASTTGGGVDDALVMQVPPGRIWVMRAVGAYLEVVVSAVVTTGQINLAITGFQPPDPGTPAGSTTFDSLPELVYAMPARFAGAIVAAATLPLRFGVDHEFAYPLILRAGQQIIGRTADFAATTPAGTMKVWAAIHDLPQ